MVNGCVCVSVVFAQHRSTNRISNKYRISSCTTKTHILTFTFQIKISRYYRPKIYCYSIQCLMYVYFVFVHSPIVRSFVFFLLVLPLLTLTDTHSSSLATFHLFILLFHFFVNFTRPSHLRIPITQCCLFYFSVHVKIAITYRSFQHFCAWASGHFYVIDI